MPVTVRETGNVSRDHDRTRLRDSLVIDPTDSCAAFVLR